MIPGYDRELWRSSDLAREQPIMETTLDILFLALEIALNEGEISEEQYSEAYEFLMTLKG